MKIIVRYVRLRKTHARPVPIPDRRFDYVAVTDDYDLGSPIGHGTTAAKAIRDLRNQIEDIDGQVPDDTPRHHNKRSRKAVPL